MRAPATIGGPDGTSSSVDSAAIGATIEPMRQRLPAVLVMLAVAVGLGLPAARPAEAAVKAASVPAAWPFDKLQIGFADGAGGAAALRPTHPSASATSTSRAA